MSDFIMGIYWYERQQTLRQYADSSHAFIGHLKAFHRAFQFLEWVGNRPDNAAKLANDLSNLDALIYTFAQDKEAVYQNPNTDGTASWNSLGSSGYGMGYSTGKSIPGGDVVIRIGAGRTGPRNANRVTITFPSHEIIAFPYREFFDHDFLIGLLLQLVDFWKPEHGRLTSYAFSEAVSTSMTVAVGWLTYVRDPRAAALRNSPSLKKIILHPTPDGGTLMSLGRTPVSPDNPEQVENARVLRRILIDEGLVPS